MGAQSPNLNKKAFLFGSMKWDCSICCQLFIILDQYWVFLLRNCSRDLENGSIFSILNETTTVVQFFLKNSYRESLLSHIFCCFSGQAENIADETQQLIDKFKNSKKIEEPSSNCTAIKAGVIFLSDNFSSEFLTKIQEKEMTVEKFLQYLDGKAL